MVVILAGYEEDMEQMLQTNPGLKSRFSERLHFEDLTAPQTAHLLTCQLQRKNKLSVNQQDR
jgi:hypothetical protein